MVFERLAIKRTIKEIRTREYEIKKYERTIKETNGMTGVLDIVLERDGHDQPWGFRLQGGIDIGTALSVQRVSIITTSFELQFI